MKKFILSLGLVVLGFLASKYFKKQFIDKDLFVCRDYHEDYDDTDYDDPRNWE